MQRLRETQPDSGLSEEGLIEIEIKIKIRIKIKRGSRNIRAVAVGGMNTAGSGASDIIQLRRATGSRMTVNWACGGV
jgi:hypothetical protein